ncbi:MAG: hypothetical protein P4L22_01605 [Candidatus Babeliales bacterium]|nr:hypothetical protein [Candidatus Babeliales bacterium]
MNKFNKILAFFQTLVIFVSPIAGITSICGFVYGFYWVRNHKIQQRMDHRSEEARKALDHLFEVKLLLKEAFEGDACDRKEVLDNRLPILLNNLLNTLFFIKHSQAIEDLKKMLNDLLEAVVSYEDIKNSEIVCSRVKSIIYQNNHNRLDDLKIVLLEIYEMKR